MTETLAPARELLESYAPRDAEQARVRDRILRWIDRYPEDAHLRSRLEGHLTASALVVDPDRARVLLHHHRKLGRWLQFGGHCDGEADLRRVAWRETVEESGVVPAWMSETPVDLDVHEIPAYGGVPAHLHLDVRFVATAARGAEGRVSGESWEVRWFGVGELGEAGVDASVRRLVEVVVG